MPDHGGFSSDLIDASYEVTRDSSLLSDILSDAMEIYSDDDTIIYSDIQNCLNILSINVGGLSSKVQTPDFENFINKYDLICFQETHFDICDFININGFKSLPNITRANARYKSGGISVLVSDSIYDRLKVVKNVSENFYWFSSSICSHVLFCATYIPSEGNYSNISIFDSLEADLLELNPNNNLQICLLGDFNARTGNEHDFVFLDVNIEQILRSHNPNDELNRTSIHDLGFPTERYNSDHAQLNNYGKRLLEVCK